MRIAQDGNVSSRGFFRGANQLCAGACELSAWVKAAVKPRSKRYGGMNDKWLAPPLLLLWCAAELKRNSSESAAAISPLQLW